MKILHTVQGYYPYIGGSEELVRKVSEQMVIHGHDVTVYTSVHPERNYNQLHGVKIKQFNIKGNSVRGIKGETERYIDSVLNSDYDIIMNYAAQTWATDLLLPLLDRIKSKKILAPVGYSGLSDRRYERYFNTLPFYLRKYDNLIYHSSSYQDKVFGDKHKIDKYAIISNFADGDEFKYNTNDFKEKYKITQTRMLLNVANHYVDKGHQFVIDAFLNADIDDAILVIIGNPTNKIKINSDCYYQCKIRQLLNKGKLLVLSDVPRSDVIAAYNAADLFLFGSKVECSPLVIFEAMASKTTWVSTNVGNLSEIQNGILVKDTDEMSDIIRIYMDDERLRDEAALSAYKEWEINYEYRKIVNKYLNVYKETLSMEK